MFMIEVLLLSGYKYPYLYLYSDLSTALWKRKHTLVHLFICSFESADEWICSLTLGVFGLSCRTTDHYRAGMRQFYTVKSCTQSQNTEITSFQPDVYFYLAAEEEVWNYAPNRTWEFEKHTTTLRERLVLVTRIQILCVQIFHIVWYFLVLPQPWKCFPQ